MTRQDSNSFQYISCLHVGVSCSVSRAFSKFSAKTNKQTTWNGIEEAQIISPIITKPLFKQFMWKKFIKKFLLMESTDLNLAGMQMINWADLAYEHWNAKAKNQDV